MNQGRRWGRGLHGRFWKGLVKSLERVVPGRRAWQVSEPGQHGRGSATWLVLVVHSAFSTAPAPAHACVRVCVCVRQGWGPGRAGLVPPAEGCQR